MLPSMNETEAAPSARVLPDLEPMPNMSLMSQDFPLKRDMGIKFHQFDPSVNVFGANGA
jgi:hypothetical protein